jgi:NitT/TauT family transport system substrate-binding protein
MRRRMAMAAVVAAVLMAGCGSDDSADSGGSAGAAEQTEVTLGVVPVIDVAPVYLGREKGFFSSRGIDLEIKTAQGGAALLPAVMQGEMQFGFSNYTSLILAQSRKLPVKVVASGVASTGKAGSDFSGVVVPANSPIQTPSQLAGKRVAVNTLNNIGDTTVRASVRKGGGDPTSIKFTELALPDMPAALQRGDVDAAWVTEPWLSITKASGARVVAWNLVDTAPDLSLAGYFTTEQTMSGKADLVTRFREAVAESMQYASEHPDEARNIISTYTKIDAPTIKSLTLPQWPAEINRPSVETLAQLAVSDGLVKESPDLNALLP